MAEHSRQTLRKFFNFPASAPPPPPFILLLEDEEVLRIPLAGVLGRAGYVVVSGASADDGMEAVVRLGWDAFHLVIADAHLGRDPAVRNGILFHARWRSLFPVPPFIFMFGWGEPVPPEAGSCLVYGLAKPFEISDLLTLVRAILGR